MQSNQARIFWGSFFVLLGLAFFGQTFLPFNVWSLFGKLWPLFIIGVGAWVLLRQPKSWVPAVIILIVGALLLLGSLGVLQVNVWSLWPLILIGVGLSMIFRPHGIESTAGEIESLTDTTLFGASKRVIESKKFKFASLTTIFGGTELDLSHLKLSEDATIEVLTIFGGVEIKAPEGANVVNQVTAILGGVEDKHAREKGETGKPKLYVKGTVIFAGVEIK